MTGDVFKHRGTCKYPVHAVFSPDDQQLWYDIPGFPSYQFSYNGYIRSFKIQGTIYPYGYLLSFRRTSEGDMFTMTDRDNFVRLISFEELKNLVDCAKPYLHCYHTFEDPHVISRNIRAFTNQIANANLPGKVIRKPINVRRIELNNLELGTIPTFNNLRDFFDDEEKRIITPIRFVEVPK